MMTGVCVTSDAPSTVTRTFIPARPAQQRGDISRYLVQPRETGGPFSVQLVQLTLHIITCWLESITAAFSNNHVLDVNHDDYIYVDINKYIDI